MVDDNVPQDLLNIIRESRADGIPGVHNEALLLEKLLVYTTDRDTKVMVHGSNIILNYTQETS